MRAYKLPFGALFVIRINPYPMRLKYNLIHCGRAHGFFVRIYKLHFGVQWVTNPKCD